MKRLALAVLSLMLVMGLSAVAYAGPGSVVIKTDGDITARFGAQVRMIPTYEKDWDFGIRDRTGNGAFSVHVNEASTVGQGYIRSEDRLYFNFAKGDIWDVYFALEFDDALSSRAVDRVRATQGDFAAFGVERLNASVKLPWIFSRFNAGWDVYTVDLDGGSLVYTDDDPGFSIVGGVANIDWKLGYHKVIESNRRITANSIPAATITNTGFDNDRDIYSARVNFTLFKDTKIGLIYALNDQKVRGNFPTTDNCVAPTCQEVNAHFISPIFTASIAGFKIAAQYAHMFGDAEKMGVNNASVTNGNYDIDSNAFFGDIAYDMTPWFGFRFIPHVGVLWTQGDDNPNDDKLEGYVGKNFQRFIPSFGGENTILGDTNPVIGTILYSFLPDQRGNQNGTLGVGGLVGTGRGDNPGLLLVGGGITIDPIKNWSYRTNGYYMRYNEDLCVQNVNAAGQCGAGDVNKITDHGIGVAWDNEISWWLDKNMVVKGQFSFIFPTGDAIKQITQQLSGVATDDTAIRLALELLWNF
ncbi:MAG: hypothetical protein HYY12_08580 [Candidatus Methylomirabilis oxyfera]|nr:hypothetical protein [Candidatus Methylomirabilis oxyfera]